MSPGLVRRKGCLTALTPRAIAPYWDPNPGSQLKLCTKSSQRMSQQCKRGLKLSGKQEVQVTLEVTKPDILRLEAKWDLSTAKGPLRHGHS